MALDHAFIAATRFGLGARPGELDSIAGDTRGWLVHQLDRPHVPQAIAALPRPDEQVRRFFALRQQEKQQRQVAKADRPMMMARATVNEPFPASPMDSGAAARAVIANLAEPIRELYLGEASARTLAAVDSETPLVERLVAFWSNHFTVSIQRGEVAGLCGPFERQAIRPHVLGHFVDMLTAVVRHPAMLVYLDNARSIGPGSLAARRGRNVGLNENLGRELLELHTLGVKGGYNQHDVEQMARMLTGWTITPPDRPGGGEFHFEPRVHEPGPKLLLGAIYREAGMQEAEAALVALARHPSTARHLAEKLARHFIADDPPPAAVERIAAAYQRSDGDLKATTRAVIDSPEAWRDPLMKVKSPQDLVVSLVRTTGYASPDPKVLVNSLRVLGQPPFAAPSPAGWPDRANEWLSPEALMHRIEWSRAAAQKMARALPARIVAQETIGPVAAPATMQAIAGTSDPVEQLTLLFASREFQRR